jgi:hypothetical protein
MQYWRNLPSTPDEKYLARLSATDSGTCQLYFELTFVKQTAAFIVRLSFAGLSEQQIFCRLRRGGDPSP